MRLIDADALLESYTSYTLVPTHEFITNLITNAPTIQQGWVSVDDRLPSNYQYVISLEDDGEIYKVMFVANQEGNFWADAQGYYYHNVTHWMPLPEPPKLNEE